MKNKFLKNKKIKAGKFIRLPQSLKDRARKTNKGKVLTLKLNDDAFIVFSDEYAYKTYMHESFHHQPYDVHYQAMFNRCTELEIAHQELQEKYNKLKEESERMKLCTTDQTHQEK